MSNTKMKILLQHETGRKTCYMIIIRKKELWREFVSSKIRNLLSILTKRLKFYNRICHAGCFTWLPQSLLKFASVLTRLFISIDTPHTLPQIITSVSPVIYQSHYSLIEQLGGWRSPLGIHLSTFFSTVFIHFFMMLRRVLSHEDQYFFIPIYK